MSMASMMKTCAACGKAFTFANDEVVKTECLIDYDIRYVVVHEMCSIFSHKKEMRQENE